jgi:hypothetical protein
MGFNRRKMDAERKALAASDAASQRATDAQVLEDAEHLIGAWNERQARRMPMLFSPETSCQHHGPKPCQLHAARFGDRKGSLGAFAYQARL